MRPTLTIFKAMICACMCCELASTCLMYRYIHTNIHKDNGFLVVLISVGLAQARPNNTRLCTHAHEVHVCHNRPEVWMLYYAVKSLWL